MKSRNMEEDMGVVIYSCYNWRMLHNEELHSLNVVYKNVVYKFKMGKGM